MTKLILGRNAVDYLFGGEDGASVEIRQSIAQQFAKRHLKAIANSATFEKVMESLKDQILEEVRQRLGARAQWKDSHGTMRISPGAELNGMIHAQIKEIVGSLDKGRWAEDLRRQIALAEQRLAEMIKVRMDLLESRIGEHVDGALTKHLEATIQNEVKQRLARVAAAIGTLEESDDE